jgi:hypothetical protein
MVMISPFPGVSAGVQLPAALQTVELPPVQVRITSVASMENSAGGSVLGVLKVDPALEDKLE